MPSVTGTVIPSHPFSADQANGVPDVSRARQSQRCFCAVRQTAPTSPWRTARNSRHRGQGMLTADFGAGFTATCSNAPVLELGRHCQGSALALRLLGGTYSNQGITVLQRKLFRPFTLSFEEPGEDLSPFDTGSRRVLCPARCQRMPSRPLYQSSTFHRPVNSARYCRLVFHSEFLRSRLSGPVHGWRLVTSLHL